MRFSWFTDEQLFLPDMPARLDMRTAGIVDSAIRLQGMAGTGTAATYLNVHGVPITTALRVLARRQRRAPASLYMFSRLRPRALPARQGQQNVAGMAIERRRAAPGGGAKKTGAPAVETGSGNYRQATP